MVETPPSNRFLRILRVVVESLVIVVILRWAYHRWVSGPWAELLESQEQALEALDRRVEMARAAERKLPQFREEVTRLREENAKLVGLLPSSFGRVEAGAVMGRLARESGVAVREARETAPPQSDAVLATVKLEVDAAGPFRGVQTLLRRIDEDVPSLDVTGILLDCDAAGACRETLAFTATSDARR